MNILFLHQNFPGQFRHLAQHLAAQEGWNVIGLGDARNTRVRKVGERLEVLTYQHDDTRGGAHPYLLGLEARVRRGQSVLRALLALRKKGFVPHIVCVHPSWGEALFVKEVFPKARLLAYCEFYYHASGADVGFDAEFTAASLDEQCQLRLRNMTNLMAVSECDRGWSPTRWQADRFPAALQGKITVLHDGIDTALARPADGGGAFEWQGRRFASGEPIVTFVARNLEPYRGFHVFMRALPRILREHPRADVFIVGGDEVSYGRAPAAGGSWRTAMLAELGERIDSARVHFTGRLPHDAYLRLLQVSGAHVYLTYPFVLSWSMLEAMACGCALVASATAPVVEVIEDGVNGLLFDFFDADALADKVGVLLADPASHTAMRAAARATIVEKYDLATVCLPAQVALLRDLAQDDGAPPQ